MILPLLSAIVSTTAAAAAAQWTKANQPAQTLLQSATILSDGRWVGVDTSYTSWISTNKGTSWSAFKDADGSTYADILGNGISVTWQDNGGMKRYDVSTSTWIASTFDRALTTGGDTTTTWPYFGLEERDNGRNYYWLDRTDSALFFVSTDSARTWKSIAALPESRCPGGCAEYAGFTNGMIWAEDTATRHLRGTRDGSHWVDIPFSAGMAGEMVMDSLAGGDWIVEMLDSNGNYSWKTTADTGKTWKSFDPSPAGSLPWSTEDISDGWQTTFAYISGTERAYVRPSSGAWTLLPALSGDTWNKFFVDNGRIYGTGDSGLVSLDLGVLGVRERSTTAVTAISWRMEGSDLVVSNAAAATGWELRDLSGRNLATGKSTGASELRISTGDRKGLLLVRLTGFAPQAFSVLAP